MSTTHRQYNLNHVRVIGIPVVVAIGSCFVSIIWIGCNWAYSTYLQPKIAVTEVSESRKELESAYRESLKKSGFKSDVNLNSFTDEMLKAENRKLQKALRAGK